MKKWSKHAIPAALVCMLLLTILPAKAQTLTWQTHWSSEYVQMAKGYGWIEADEHGEIPVNEELTRGEFAIILWRVLGSPDAQAECPYKDVTAAEQKTAVSVLYELSITQGIDDEKFNPEALLPREQAVVFLARAFNLAAEDPDAAASFDDWADVASWAQDAMAAMVEQGFIVGIGNNRLAPDKSLTLGEMAKLISLIYNSASNTTISADDAIVGVSTIGFVDTDGAKLSTIVVEYNVDLTGAALGVNTYQINNYGLEQGNENCGIGSDPGVPLKAYVNNEASVSESGGSGTGKYVIIEVNTDYQLESVCDYYDVAMYADVLQKVAIRTDSYTITPNTEAVENYTSEEVINYYIQTGEIRSIEVYNHANEGTFTIQGTEVYQRYTIEDGNAFYATNCFDESNGQYWDFYLPYALYVPEDYDPALEYALVLHIHDAGAMKGSDPMITLTESQGPVNLASDEVQQIAKDQGLGGAIIVAPQLAEEFYMNEENPKYNLRSTQDNWTVGAAVPATWELLDYLTGIYNIDTDRIYGSGQSMGAMQLLAMAAQRDNYFAGLLLYGSQWGNNYTKSTTVYNGQTYYDTPVDGTLVWAVDADGNECDYRNWYYMISDDNVLFFNCMDDPYSTNVWNEAKYLFYDLAGAEFPKASWNPLTLSKEDQNAELAKLLAMDNDLGIYWAAFEGGSHLATWIYGHGVSDAYTWLLTQTRETEQTRDKLPISGEFELAETQIQTAERVQCETKDGTAYYLTGKSGSGTAGYNTTLYLLTGTVLFAAPNYGPVTTIAIN